MLKSYSCYFSSYVLNYEENNNEGFINVLVDHDEKCPIKIVLSLNHDNNNSIDQTKSEAMEKSKPTSNSKQLTMNEIRKEIHLYLDKLNNPSKKMILEYIDTKLTISNSKISFAFVLLYSLFSIIFR